ncbi:MAG: hypothetical protein ACOX7I_05535 [Oscillospiraceae bacterium]|jgi:hypothetical protein
MSFIACLGNCKYQRDGYCSLERISDWKGPVQGSDCIYYVPADTPWEADGSAENGGDSISDISN